MQDQKPATEADLADKLAALERMELDPLRAEWRRVYRSAPPPRLSRDLLVRGIAYKLQEAAYGGLRPAARRQLAAMLRGDQSARTVRPATPVSLRPGATLIRTWRGQTHTVLVIADGYEHKGKRYRSLSQIAKAITGAHWSGPRFFGLSPTAKAGADEAA